MSWAPQVQHGNAPSQQQAARGLAYPPILTTDIPGAVGENSQLNSIHAAVRIPHGFLDQPFADGIASVVTNFVGQNSFETISNYRLFAHARNDTLTGYATGWKIVDGSLDGPLNWALMGAQRQGQYVYNVTHGASSRSGAPMEQYVDRFHGLYARERRHHDNSIRYEGLGGAASGATVPSLAPGSNADLFVSDHAVPQIWFLSGNSVGHTLDDETTWAWHWRSEDQRGHGGGDTSLPYYPFHRFKYRFWHHYQDYQPPQETRISPALVHPWSAGDLGPPQMWWFVPERLATGEFTQRVHIFRSLWLKNQYRAGRGFSTLAPRWLATDPRLKVNGGTVDANPGDPLEGHVSLEDSSTNAEGFSFEHNWFSPKHFVSTVGPFRGALFGDVGGGVGNIQPVFRVIRDPSRHDRLVLGMFGQGSVFGDGWDAAWYAYSGDDGKTWGYTKQMNPFARTRNEMTQGAYSTTPTMLITTGGDVLVPATAAFQNVPSYSFAAVNYSATGAGDDDRRSTVWRRPRGTR